MMHQLPIRPRFGELDPYNHVNHSVYLAWFEAGRCEALDAIGIPLHVLADRGFQIVVVEVQVSFLRPALAGDDLVVETWVEEHRGITSTWRQQVVRAGSTAAEHAERVLCTGTVRAGICDVHGRPTRNGRATNAELAALSRP